VAKRPLPSGRTCDEASHQFSLLTAPQHNILKFCSNNSKEEEEEEEPT
jgi:hypothetical protein